MRVKSFKFSRAASVLLALITALAAAFSCLSVSARAELDSVAVRQGVVPVVFYMRNVKYLYVDPNTMGIVDEEPYGDEVGMSSGSGFFVGNKGENPQYIVTNHHVVADFIEMGDGGFYRSHIGWTRDGYAVYVQAESSELRIYYDDNDYDLAYTDCYGDQDKVDLAVLRLRAPTDKRKALKIGTVSEENVGDTVYTVGYPGNADNILSNASHYGLNDSSVHKGSMVRFAMDTKGVERISVDATIQHGNSGGPLVNESGYVIGVNTNVISDSPYTNQIEADYYSLSANTLTDFLDKNNIPYEKAGKGFNPVPIIIIAAAVVVAAAGVVVVLMLKKKGGSAPKAAPAAAPAAPAAPAGAMIICERGILAGRTFPLGNGVVIGRNPQKCGVCFPVDTKGVSGAHCELRRTANGFEILDLGSSYGTTLGSGQKLTPNVPIFIPTGTYFSIGSADQLFQIKY